MFFFRAPMDGTHCVILHLSFSNTGFLQYNTSTFVAFGPHKMETCTGQFLTVPEIWKPFCHSSQFYLTFGFFLCISLMALWYVKCCMYFIRFDLFTVLCLSRMYLGYSLPLCPACFLHRDGVPLMPSWSLVWATFIMLRNTVTPLHKVQTISNQLMTNLQNFQTSEVWEIYTFCHAVIIMRNNI